MINAKKLVPDVRFGGGVGWVNLTLNVDDVPASQTDVVFTKVKMPYPFQIEQIDAYCQTLTGTATVASAKINAGSNLITAAAPGTTTAAPVTLAFSAAGTVAARRGTTGDAIVIGLTTAGGAAIENLTLSIWVRPFPMAGEAN